MPTVTRHWSGVGFQKMIGSGTVAQGLPPLPIATPTCPWEHQTDTGQARHTMKHTPPEQSSFLGFSVSIARRLKRRVIGLRFSDCSQSRMRGMASRSASEGVRLALEHVETAADAAGEAPPHRLEMTRAQATAAQTRSAVMPLFGSAATPSRASGFAPPIACFFADRP